MNNNEKIKIDINKVWVSQLEGSFYRISKKVAEHSKILNPPIFCINDEMNTYFATWTPNNRHMTFSSNLLKNFEWGAVEHVMKHEVAHQIVSEIFNADCYGVAHGELWKIACNIVGIEPRRCEDPAFLASFKGIHQSPLVEKIKKLLIKGNDKAVTKEESQLFLEKAQELMIRHNISLKQLSGEERVFVTRPVGNNYKKMPSWVWNLAYLVSEHYNVKYIQTYYGANRRIELFGEPSNLDIAEYVYHAILCQAELIYNNFIREHKIKMKTDVKYFEENSRATYFGGRYRIARKISKRAFITGLISGYSNKLNSSKKVVLDKIRAEDGCIIPTNDGLLKEMYDKHYSNKRNVSIYSSRNNNGFRSGREAGNNMKISQGLHSSSVRGNLICA